MDRNLSVTTPESIAFSYELAGLGSRFLALCIDMLLQILVLALIFGSLVLIGGNAKPVHRADEQLISSIASAIIVAIVFIVFFGYFILFESLWGGRTPGKYALGLRVVRDGGYPIDFGSALIRNLVRVAELGLGFYAISALAALVSKENKRLGDMAAGTVVVRDARRVASLAALRRDAQNAPPPLLLTPQELEVVDRFVARRHSMERNARGLLAARIAGRLRPRLSADLRALDDEQLLERLSGS